MAESLHPLTKASIAMQERLDEAVSEGKVLVDRADLEHALAFVGWSYPADMKPIERLRAALARIDGGEKP